MYSSTRRGPGRGATLLAVLQVLLLLSALVLTTSAVIAQDGDHASGQEPVAEQTGETPAAGAGSSDPGPEPKAAPPTISERGLALRLYPQKIRSALGGKRIVSAWLCPANDRTPFGGQIKGDGKPGTKDDKCKPVQVKWSLAGDGARLSNKSGYKTRVILTAKQANKLTAKVGDQKRNARVIVKKKPARVRPEAPAILAEIRAQQAEAKAKAKASKPVAQQAPAEEPTDVPAEPAEEPTEAPAEEPTDVPAEPAEDVSYTQHPAHETTALLA